MLKKALSLIVMLVLAATLAACDSGGGATATQVVLPTGTPLQAISAPTQPPTTAPPIAPTQSDGFAGATQTAMVAITPTIAPTIVPITATVAVTSTQGTSGEPRMIIETAKGRIVLRLYTDQAAGVSKTIVNFAQKANAGYFDGLVFHRVEDWVVQGGDPAGTGSGGGTMPSEYNQLPFEVGSLGVARRNDPAVNNDSQFFIVKDAVKAAGLVGQYTNWGKVTEGMNVVNELAVGDKMTTVRVEGVDLSALPTAAPTLVPTVGPTAAPAFMRIETAKGNIVLKLHTEASAKVSITIQNFAKKANNGYFDGLTFHRVENWVIQGGDPQGTGMGGGQIPSEYNDLPFTAGSLGVARGNDPSINNDSQFFIVKQDSFHLNSQYTNWGQVVEGMDVVSKIVVGDKITKIRVEGVTIVQEPDHITVQHILIAFDGALGFQGGNPLPEKAKGRTQEQARTLAYQLLDRANAGEDFSAMVTEFTDDQPPGIYSMANTGVPTQVPTGTEQEFSRGGMVPAFGNVGFRLQVGEIGISDYDTTKSPYGYHIIKRTK